MVAGSRDSRKEDMGFESVDTRFLRNELIILLEPCLLGMEAPKANGRGLL